MAKFNLDLNNTEADNVITDELVTDAGTSKFNLYHDKFYGSTNIRIWTAAGETGTQLTENVDYTIESLDSELSDRAVALVYSSIQIINATYQSGNLYFNYNVCADLVDANDRYAYILPTGTDFIIDNGNVGIGTTSPSDKLHVVDIRTDNENAALFIQQTGVNPNGTIYGMVIEKTGASRTNVGGVFSATGATNNNYGLLVPNGKVGIGVVSPGKLLEVDGDAGYVDATDMGSTDADFASKKYTDDARDEAIGLALALS